MDQFSQLNCDHFLETVLQMVENSQMGEEKMKVYNQLEAADIRIQKHIKAMNTFKEENKGEGIFDINEMRKKFQECLSEVGNVKGILKKQLKEARAKANDTEDEEEDLEGVTVYVNKDPFTKKKIQNPMKSKVCNHVFDEESASEMLKKGEGFKCPVFGCKTTITDGDLEEFPQFFDLCDH